MAKSKHLTEKQALAQAKKKGIEFEDSFRLMKIGSGEFTDQTYKTRPAAEKSLVKRKDRSKYTIAQIRSRKP